MLQNKNFMTLKGIARNTVIIFGVFVLAACGGEDGSVEKKVEGERISVLSFERQLEVDPRLKNQEITLPVAYTNTDWTQPGGFPDNIAHHLALGNSVKKLFSQSIVEGSDKNIIITAPPLVAEGKVFALGADMEVAAADANTGKRLWRTEIAPEDSEIEDGFGGGIAYENGRIFAATGFGEIVALDAASGRIEWRAQNVIPFRTAPTVAKGQIYVISHDNQLQVYSTENGKRLWNQLAILEPATIMSAPSPAVSGDLVVAGFSSGELMALRTNNGTLNWSDSLSRVGQLTPLSDLNPIVGRPVIDRDRVFAISHGGRMVSIDLRSGERIWMSEFTSIETPWVAGDYIFIVTTDAKVICLSRNQGRVYWVKQLEHYINGNFEKPVIWAGPVLAGERLLLASSKGELVSLSPYTGDVLSTLDVDDAVNVTPVVANNTIYILNASGRLLAFR